MKSWLTGLFCAATLAACTTPPTPPVGDDPAVGQSDAIFPMPSMDAARGDAASPVIDGGDVLPDGAVPPDDPVKTSLSTQWEITWGVTAHTFLSSTRTLPPS